MGCLTQVTAITREHVESYHRPARPTEARYGERSGQALQQLFRFLVEEDENRGRPAAQPLIRRIGLRLRPLP